MMFGVDLMFGGLFKIVLRNLVFGMNVKGGEKYYGF